MGAGALGVSGSVANASSILYSGPVHHDVQGTGAIIGPNGAGASLQRFYCVVTCVTDNSVFQMVPKRGSKGTTFRALATHAGSLASAFPSHAVWSTNFKGKSARSAVIAYGGTAGTGTQFNATDRYLLFRFEGGALPYDLYGWAQLYSTDGSFGIVEWAYDPSGAQLPAGETSTPEPSTAVLTGLAALALGAKGLRAWRAARKGA